MDTSRQSRTGGGLAGPHPTTDSTPPGARAATSTSPAGRRPLPRRTPRRPTPDLRQQRTPFATSGDSPLSPADTLFTSPGHRPGEFPPPAGPPHAPHTPSRRQPAGGTHPATPPTPATTRTGPLFAPVNRRGPGSVDGRAAGLDETTPIFDEMVSAWFRAATDPAPAAPARRQETRATESWRFTADAGFSAARAVSQAEPVEFTDSGLPRRRPRQNLIPGSVVDPTSTTPAHRGMAADDIRARLSDYRHGIRRARHRQDDPAPTHTAGGLPRRTPLNTLSPGTPAAPPPATGPHRTERAEELRGRLGSFQKGLSRGRRSLADRASATGGPDNKQQQESE